MLARLFFKTMTNDDLANAALARLGEITSVSNLDNESSKTGSLCARFYKDAIREVLMLGRWNAATKRADLALVTPAPVSGFTNHFEMPGDCLRILEINGEEFGTSQERFEIEGRMILSNEAVCTIRYIGTTATVGFPDNDITITLLGPLLCNAIVCRLAQKIAVPLTGSAEKQALMDQQFAKALAEARFADAQECGSRENTGWERVFGRSRLLAARGTTRNPERLEG